MPPQRADLIPDQVSRILVDADVFSLHQRDAMTAIRARLEEMATVPLPARGRTEARWRWLADLAREDLSLARLAEGHLDARAILIECDRADLLDHGCWGVWAAEPGQMRAEHRGRHGWRLIGEKRWCSGSVALDHALVTAVAEDGPRLFAVPASAGQVVPGSWCPLGMEATASHTLRFDTQVDDRGAIGGPNAYVERPGFWHGAAGVAACWYGGATGVAEGLRRRVLDDAAGSAGAAWGRVRARLDAGGALLERVARGADAFPQDLPRARIEAISLRLAVTELAELVLRDVTVEGGAGALAHDEPHWRRVADLTLYLRQLHSFRDARSLGELAGEAYRW
ncbi:MAG: hypothetical protein WKF43_00860 [Acidimicrobiales bacterium]